MADDLDQILAKYGAGAAAPPSTPAPDPYGPRPLLVSAPPEQAPDLDAVLAKYRPQTGVIESAVRGVAQGATLGFADELTGAIEAAFTPKTYEEARDESRAAYDTARADNPVAFGAGEVGGGLATMFVPGLGVARAAKGATAAAKLAGSVGRAAAGGIASGAGYSDAKDVEGVARDAAVGGLVSGGVAGALGLVGRGIGKVAGKYADAAPERFEKHLAEDISEGATSASRKRLAQLRPGMLSDVIGDDEALRRSFTSPVDALGAVKERVDELVSKPRPIYEQVDQAVGKAKLGDVLKTMDDEIAKAAADPGADTWASLLRQKRDSFANAARAAAGGAKKGENVDVDTHFLRRWATNVGKEADKSLGSLGETERFALKDRMAGLSKRILDERLDDAVAKDASLAPVIENLREVNKKLATYAKVEEVLESRELRERIGAKTLAKYVNGGNLLMLAGLAGGAMSPMPIIAGAAAKGALMGGKALDRAATAKLAALARAARARGGTVSLSKAAEEALAAGVPEPTVRAMVGGARAAGMDGDE